MLAELEHGSVELPLDNLPLFTRTVLKSFGVTSAKRGIFGQREPCPGRSLGPLHAMADAVHRETNSNPITTSHTRSQTTESLLDGMWLA